VRHDLLCQGRYRGGVGFSYTKSIAPTSLVFVRLEANKEGRQDNEDKNHVLVVREREHVRGERPKSKTN